jgi:hypothetical protein
LETARNLGRVAASSYSAKVLAKENSMTIKAIETEYGGYLFRSRLEARWAVFLDELGIAYEYEREGYEVATGVWYMPDFHIADGWLEIKHKDYNDDGALEKMGALVAGLNEPGIIVYGEPFNHQGVLFLPHFLKPGYIRHLANFNNLTNAKEAARIAQQVRFEHGAGHAR